MRVFPLVVLMAFHPAAFAQDVQTTRISVALDRGPDLGQNFGSLFEATSDDGRLTIGAGFQNAYNTRYRADRHAIQSLSGN